MIGYSEKQHTNSATQITRESPYVWEPSAANSLLGHDRRCRNYDAIRLDSVIAN
jgi:hypothetical protein